MSLNDTKSVDRQSLVAKYSFLRSLVMIPLLSSLLLLGCKETSTVSGSLQQPSGSSPTTTPSRATTTTTMSSSTMQSTTPTTVPSVPTTTTLPSGSATIDATELDFLNLINAYRAQNGAGPLQVSAALQNSSVWMSTDMANKNYFSHTDSLGRDPGSRIQSFGYSSFTWGENIAAGSSDAQSALNQWINACDPDSSGTCTYAHRMNMLNPSFKVIGIGRAYNSNSTYKWYWTTDFGGTVDQTIPVN